MIRSVLDANVVVSGVLGFERAESAPGEIVRAWVDGEFVLVVSGPLVDEIERTLRNPYFAPRIDARRASLVANGLRDLAEWTTIDVSVSGAATHPEDDLILATAVSATVDFLVTGDRQLLTLRSFGGVPIIGSRAFLTELATAT